MNVTYTPPVRTGVRIPWVAKLAAKLVLSRLPLGYGVWQKIGLFRHGRMDQSSYALEVFDGHMTRTGLKDLRGMTMLELGPGDSISTVVIAAAHGARAILVDAGDFVRTDVEPYRSLADTLAQRGLRPPPIDDADSIAEILERCHAIYLPTGVAGLRQLPADSVDLIFSQAVLEHVFRADFREIMRECRRLLRAGGVCSHKVDLRDHLGGMLNNLRFSESVWESRLFWKSGFYTNRIRFEEMLDLFRAAGFESEVTESRRWKELPTPREKLSESFRELPDDDLCVSGFAVLLR